MQFQLYSINKDFVNIAAYETEPEQEKKSNGEDAFIFAEKVLFLLTLTKSLTLG